MRNGASVILTAAGALVMIAVMTTNAQAVTVVNETADNLKDGDYRNIEFTAPDDYPWVWRLTAETAPGWEHKPDTQDPDSSPWVPTGFSCTSGYWTSDEIEDSDSPERNFQREFTGQLRRDSGGSGGEPQTHDFTIKASAGDYFVKPPRPVVCVSNTVTLTAYDSASNTVVSTWSIAPTNGIDSLYLFDGTNTSTSVTFSSSEPNEYKVTGTSTNNTEHTDVAEVTVIEVDIDVDADNDGDIDVEDDPLENYLPGKVVWADKDAYWRDRSSPIESDIIPVDLAFRGNVDVVPDGLYVVLEWKDLESGEFYFDLFEDSSATTPIPVCSYTDPFIHCNTGTIYGPGDTLPDKVYLKASQFAFSPSGDDYATIIDGKVSLIVKSLSTGDELIRDEVKVTVANTPATSPKAKEFWMWEEEYTHDTNYHGYVNSVWEAVEYDQAGSGEHEVPYAERYYRQCNTNITASEFADLDEASILVTAHHGTSGYVYPVAFPHTPAGETNAMEWATALGSTWAEKDEWADSWMVKVKTSYFEDNWKSQRDSNNTIFFTTACYAGVGPSGGSLPSFVESVGGAFAFGKADISYAHSTMSTCCDIIEIMRGGKWRTANGAFHILDLADDDYAMAGDGKVTLWPAPQLGSSIACYPKEHHEEGTAMILFDTILGHDATPLWKDSGDAQMTGSIPIWMDYDGHHAGVRWPYTADSSAAVKTHIRARSDHCETPWSGAEDTGKDLAGDGWSCGMDKEWEF